MMGALSAGDFDQRGSPEVMCLNTFLLNFSLPRPEWISLNQALRALVSDCPPIPEEAYRANESFTAPDASNAVDKTVMRTL